jgi:hypothetical protein
MARTTDRVKDKPWLEVGTQGAEYGALRWKDGACSRDAYSLTPPRPDMTKQQRS